ncbi:glycosyltransferase family 2 protein [uncultured Pseudoalteromonas sp.]|uniref:glycosyltransferase family 2 protein n=1 Tax=uncultured Pseudoalteromonas sp. TaxID=114053 RepID=UPI0030C8803D
MKNKENKLTVAVVIPMYNSANTILRALTSLENQTVKPSRVLVIDDGSVDESVNIVENYIDSSSLKINLVSQENSGPSAARNKGISLVHEELVCFLDADDEWLQDKLKEQLDLYSKKCSSHNIGLIETFTTDTCGNTKIKRDIPILEGHHFKDFLNGNAIKATASVMVPLSVLNEFGGFDESLHYAEDRLLWSQIAEKYDVFTIQKYLVTRHFGTEGNITSNPDKYYKYKKEFINVFLSKYSHKLSKEEIKRFKLLNIYEFLTVFYTKRDYKNTIKCFKEMKRISKTSIYMLNFYPFLKYISSIYHLKFKR